MVTFSVSETYVFLHILMVVFKTYREYLQLLCAYRLGYI